MEGLGLKKEWPMQGKCLLERRRVVLEVVRSCVELFRIIQNCSNLRWKDDFRRGDP